MFYKIKQLNDHLPRLMIPSLLPGVVLFCRLSLIALQVLWRDDCLQEEFRFVLYSLTSHFLHRSCRRCTIVIRRTLFTETWRWSWNAACKFKDYFLFTSAVAKFKHTSSHRAFPVMCLSGREPAPGRRLQHQDRRLWIQQRVFRRQQAGHLLRLPAVRRTGALPGEEVRRPRGGHLEPGGHLVHPGQWISALWWTEPQGEWLVGDKRLW